MSVCCYTSELDYIEKDGLKRMISIDIIIFIPFHSIVDIDHRYVYRKIRYDNIHHLPYPICYMHHSSTEIRLEKSHSSKWHPPNNHHHYYSKPREKRQYWLIDRNAADINEYSASQSSISEIMISSEAYTALSLSYHADLREHKGQIGVVSDHEVIIGAMKHQNHTWLDESTYIHTHGYVSIDLLSILIY